MYSPTIELGFLKTFQNLRVSSAAALAIVVPSGERAKCNTLDVCPLSSVTFYIDGYFHRQIWFFTKP
jgi:hypothetical protein